MLFDVHMAHLMVNSYADEERGEHELPILNPNGHDDEVSKAGLCSSMLKYL